VIQAWANSDKEQPLVVVNRSERWLNEMLKECIEQDQELILTTTTATTTGFDDNDDTHRYDNHSHIQHDDNRPRHNQISLKPTIECFNAFLDGCTRGRTGRNKRNQRIVQQNALKAESVLRKLHSYYHHYNEQASLKPNTDTFNFVIRGWTRCTYDDTIHWRVLSLLRLMESYQRSDPIESPVKPNTKSYSMAIDALIKVSKLKAREYYCNNTRLSSLNNHFNDNNNESSAPATNNNSNENPTKNGMQEMEEAHAILDYMHDLHNANVEGVVPHRVPYNILITGWAGLANYSHYTNNNAQFKAEEILRRMISHRDDGFVEASPDVISYEKVILAWANSQHPNAGQRAMWWLKQLWKEYDLLVEKQEQSVSSSSSADDSINLLPTVNTYNTTMKALARTDGALATENLLLDLGEKYQRDRLPELCPNSESFSIVIRAWLSAAEQTGNVDDRIASLRRAVEWLSSLREIENEKNLSTAPDLYVGVLRIARSAAKARPFVLDLAQDIFDDYRRSRHRLDYASYTALLQVGLNAYSRPEDYDKRRQFVHRLFFECCDDGLISNTFVRALANDQSQECKEIIDEFFQRLPLPHSWSRNLKNTKAQVLSSDISNFERNALKSTKRRSHRSFNNEY
jgi:hypothetical protein